MNIGLIGSGAIGQFLLKEINEKGSTQLEITNVFVRNKEKYQELEEKYAIKLNTDMDAFLSSGIDMVVEAANVETARRTLPQVIKKMDMLMISIGALADADFYKRVSSIASTYKRTIHLPSGAVGGLDLLQNADALGKVTDVSLTTRKPAQTLVNEALQEEKVIFEGSAAEAIELFPKNINVSIVLSLAGIGIDQTNVTIIADPMVDKNIHHVNIKGEFGEATTTISNNALPENPKTSYLAAMSVLGTLQRITKNIKIG